MNLLFLGTAGARYVVAKQLRASGGIVLAHKNSSILIDPGPGTLVYLAKHKVPLEKIAGIILSHEHLDHSADLNVLVDAMTEGGFKKRGEIFLTKSALENGILLDYLKPFPEKIVPLEPEKEYTTKEFLFRTTCPLKHGVETYGFIFNLTSGKKLGFLVDTLFFDELLEQFKNVNFLIINVVRYTPKEGVLHLCVKDVEKILISVKPELAVLTHFGMTMLRAKPSLIAKNLTEKTGVKVVSAWDGMKINLE